MVEEDRTQEFQNYIDKAMIAAQSSQVNQAQQQLSQDPQQASYIREQLYLGEELERLDYLIRGYTLEFNQDGGQRWTKPTDEDMEVLSDYGINLIRQVISWYLNKNTLLSHYDDEQILQKMKNFSHALNTSIYLKYQKVFKFPSFERCKKELMDELERKAKTKQLAYELLGKTVKLDLIKEDILKEMEGRIEHEFDKIKKRIMKTKYTQFEMIIRQVVDTVHSAYRRAYFGMERTSLRKNIYVTETNGIMPQPNKDKQGSIFNPLSWMK